jgi:hypothetical protein
MERGQNNVAAACLWAHTQDSKKSKKSKGQHKADHCGLRGVAKLDNGFTKTKKPKNW